MTFFNSISICIFHAPLLFMTPTTITASQLITQLDFVINRKNPEHLHHHQPDYTPQRSHSACKVTHAIPITLQNYQYIYKPDVTQP